MERKLPGILNQGFADTETVLQAETVFLRTSRASLTKASGNLLKIKSAQKAPKRCYPAPLRPGGAPASRLTGNHPSREYLHSKQGLYATMSVSLFVQTGNGRHRPVQRLFTRFREARNLGPAFHDRHPEQSDESALCVEHDDMIPLDLSARRDDRLSAYSGVLEPHQICFAVSFSSSGYILREPDFLHVHSPNMCGLVRETA